MRIIGPRNNGRIPLLYIHEAHEEDLRDLANQPEAREGYQRAIKLTICLLYTSDAADE